MSPTIFCNERQIASRFDCPINKMKLTSPHFEGGPRGHHTPLYCCQRWRGNGDGNDHVPEVLVIRNLAFVRFANPNIFRVPMNEVLSVFTALNW